MTISLPVKIYFLKCGIYYQMNSSELVRINDSYNQSKSKADFLNSFYVNKKPLRNSSLKYSTAVTIRLNTHPSKKGGITNEDLILEALNKLSNYPNFGCYIINYCWEMTKSCQLHLHARLAHEHQFMRKDALIYVRKTVSGLQKYSIYLQALKSKEEIKYWDLYLTKGGTENDIRPLYWRIINFYHNPDLILEDFEDLADYDIEYNRRTQHFDFIDSAKVRFRS